MAKIKDNYKLIRPSGLPRSLLKYLLYALVIGAPLIFFQATFDRFDLIKLLFVRFFLVLIFGAWVYKLIKLKRIDIYWSSIDLLLPAFLGLALLSTLFSINFIVSVLGHYYRYDGLLTYVTYALLFFLSMQIVRNTHDLDSLSVVILVTAYLVAIYAIFQYLGIDPFEIDAPRNFEAQRVFSTMGNPIFLGGYLAMILPLAVANFINVSDVKMRIVHGAGTMVLGAALLLTFSRSAWLAVLTGLLFLSYHNRNRIKSDYKRLAAILALLLFIFVALYIQSASSQSTVVNLGERLKTIVHFTSASLDTRLDIWKSAINMIKTKPILGYGPDTFRYLFQRYENMDYAKIGGGINQTDNAHDYPLHLASGVGLPATLIFLIFIVLRFKSMLTARNEELAESWQYSGLLAGILVYGISLLSGISVVGATTVFSVILGALAGAGANNHHFQVDFSNKSGKIYLAAASIIFAIVTASAFLAGSMFTADALALSARSRAKTEIDEIVVSRITEATRLYPGNGIYMSDLGYIFRGSKSGDQDERLNNAARYFKAAVIAEPLAAEHHLALGRVYHDQGKINAAVSEFKQVLKLRPLSVGARYWLGAIAYRREDFRGAVNYLLDIQSIAPGYKNSYGGLAESYKALGDKANTEKYARLAASKGK